MSSGLTYLATPYSHPDPAVEHARFIVANKCSATLMRAGHQIYSPISQTHSIALEGGIPGDWQYWEEYDKRIISICQKVIVLTIDGWKESIGVQAEIEFAKSIGLSVELACPVSIIGADFYKIENIKSRTFHGSESGEGR
jgi:hypothetical protein